MDVDGERWAGSLQEISVGAYELLQHVDSVLARKAQAVVEPLVLDDLKGGRDASEDPEEFFE